MSFIQTLKNYFSAENPTEKYNKEIENLKSSNKTIAFFNEFGELIDVFPRNTDIDLYENRGVAYSAEYIVYNQKIYNAFDVKSVESMEIPCFRYSGDVTSDLSYIMRMHRGRNDDKELQIAMSFKIASLMKASWIFWTIKDYLSLCKILMELELYDEAEILYKDAEQHINERLKQCFNDRLMGFDLIIVSNNVPCCELCAKQRERVYSISGNDKRFPKLPPNVLENRGFHKGCHCSFFPFFGVEMIGKNYDQNPVEYSNRPYVDDRSDKEKHEYEEYINRPVYPNENFYLLKEKMIVRNANLKEYNRLLEIAPHIAPKSFSGYCRMKSMRSKNYLKLEEILKER